MTDNSIMLHSIKVGFPLSLSEDAQAECTRIG
jgi:hypothetical protein